MYAITFNGQYLSRVGQGVDWTEDNGDALEFATVEHAEAFAVYMGFPADVVDGIEVVQLPEYAPLALAFEYAANGYAL